MPRNVITALLVLGLATAGAAQMAGNYTIDPGQPASSLNFRTFTAAISALQSSGISAPVSIAVASTLYTETVTINGAIPGASAANQVTFLAPGPRPTIRPSGIDGLAINGPCSYINFENLQFTGATRYALYLNGPTSTVQIQWLTFKKCIFEVGASTSTAMSAGRFEYPWDCHFQDCRFAGGGYTVYSQQQARLHYERCEFDGMNQASYVISPWNNNDSDNTYINCFFHDCGPTGRIIYLNWSQYGCTFWNNTIIARTSNEAVFLGSCCAWTRCNSFRNNIVVNLGTGPCVEFGASGNVLDYNDADYNCYWAPNAAGVLQIEGNATLESLATWKQKVGTTYTFQAGGGTSYEQNSIEADPKLASMTAPYDIHLQGTSPCLDQVDTSRVAWIQGAWVTVPANHPYIPQSVTDDFEGEARGQLVDIGADEVGVQIVLSGAPTPGGTVDLNLRSSADAGLGYQVGSSFGPGPIPIGNRRLELTPDKLLELSTSGLAPTLFVAYAGILDSTGAAVAKIRIPSIPALKGQRIYNAFITLKASAPFGVESISPTVVLSIQ